MNKRNKILVGCLALLLVLSVGYALFSETVTINGTATAKGDFEITTTCQTGGDTDIIDAFQSIYEFDGFDLDGGYENDSCVVNGTNVSMQVSLKYPTAQRMFTINFKNTGTMDAVVIADNYYIINNDSIVVYNDDDSVYKSLVKGDSEFDNYLYEFGHFYEPTLAAIKTSTGEIIVEGSDEWQARILDSSNKTSEVFYLKLEPNDTLSIIVISLWERGATMNGYSAKTTATATQQFQQVTSDMFEEPRGGTCYLDC